MALMESSLPDSMNVSIYATDISEEALKKAAAVFTVKGVCGQLIKQSQINILPKKTDDTI